MEHLSAQHSHSLGMGLAVLSPGPPLLPGTWLFQATARSVMCTWSGVLRGRIMGL